MSLLVGLRHFVAHRRTSGMHGKRVIRVRLYYHYKLKDFFEVWDSPDCRLFYPIIPDGYVFQGEVEGQVNRRLFRRIRKLKVKARRSFPPKVMLNQGVYLDGVEEDEARVYDVV